MPGTTMSPNLALNELVAKRKAEGRPILHLGFGEALLPACPVLVDELAAAASRNSYGPVAGREHVRAAVAGYFRRRNLETRPEQIVMAPGSKPLLMALDLVLPGDVLLPRPSWNSYAPQARLAGKKAFGVPIPAECGGVPDPSALRETLRTARASGADPRIMVLTLPDNPTGTLAPPPLVRRLCAIAEEEDLVIVSDEIYRDLLHDPRTPLLSPAEVAPRRTIVTTGLSKSLAAGGWRIGTARFPSGAWGERVRAETVCVASDMWSTLAGPMQAVAACAFDEPDEVRAHRTACARLHGAVARAVYEILVSVGAACRPPAGGFYVYPDFEPLRERLVLRGVTDSDSLREELFQEYDIAVLAGHHLGDSPHALRFKAATSMLYGDTEEEQLLALGAADPLQVPHVRNALTRLEESFVKLCS